MKQLSRKQLIIIFALGIGLAIGVFAYASSRHSNKTTITPQVQEQTTPTPSVNTTNTTGTSAQSPTTPVGGSPAAAGIPNKVGTPTPTPLAAPKPFYTGVDIKDTTVNVDYRLPSVADGTCTARFTKSGATSVTGTNSTSQVTNYSACKTIVIQKSSFSQLGDWSLVVTFDSNGQTTSSDQKVITIY